MMLKNRQQTILLRGGSSFMYDSGRKAWMVLGLLLLLSIFFLLGFLIGASEMQQSYEYPIVELKRLGG
jgi:hypothetical protein